MQDEQQRLNDLESYMILNTEPDSNLDKLATIASLACDTPISQITFVHDEYTWVKSNIGDDAIAEGVGKVARKDSFCQHTINDSNHILVVNDARNDKRFANNPYVINDPNICFYAGSPLKTPNGNVLGTVCILDHKPRELSEKDAKVLNEISRMAMDYLNTRKELLNQKKQVATNAVALKKLTDNLLIGIFQLSYSKDHKFKFEFINSCMAELYPTAKTQAWLSSHEIAFPGIHPDDLPHFKAHLNAAFKKPSIVNIEFRVKSSEHYNWHLLMGNTEINADGSISLFGSVRNINNSIEYENALEQIAFDISHVLRRPVTSLLEFKYLIDLDKDITKEKLLKYMGQINQLSQEMEQFTRELNDIYFKKSERIKGQKLKQVQWDVTDSNAY